MLCTQVQKHASDYYEASWGPVRELIRETPDGLGGGQALTLTREKVGGLAETRAKGHNRAHCSA